MTLTDLLVAMTLVFTDPIIQGIVGLTLVVMLLPSVFPKHFRF